MTNLFLTIVDMSAAVPSGAETTRWKLASAAGGSARVCNKNTATGPTAPLKITDGATGGTDGVSVAWYSDPVTAVTIAGQIVASLWDVESASTANVAPAIGVYRCDAGGAELATIVNPATSNGAGEMTTTASSDVVTITAANVTDTALLDGERIKVALFIDDAADHGGTGSMASARSAQFQVNGPTGSAGQAQIAFTETITGQVLTVGGARQPFINRRAVMRASTW